eukprot:2000960-Prymnesium_polylepis.1
MIDLCTTDGPSHVLVSAVLWSMSHTSDGTRLGSGTADASPASSPSPSPVQAGTQPRAHLPDGRAVHGHTFMCTPSAPTQKSRSCTKLPENGYICTGNLFLGLWPMETFSSATPVLRCLWHEVGVVERSNR